MRARRRKSDCTPPTVTPSLCGAGYGTFREPLVGDVNGDGRPDLILSNPCADPTCTTLHLRIGAAPAMPDRTYRFVTPTPLDGGEGDFSAYAPLTGDFDGDGKTDVAFAAAFSTALYIYVAHSNGDGTFTLRPPQTFLGDWGSVNFLVGDFNGDHKVDIALSQVCAVAQLPENFFDANAQGVVNVAQLVAGVRNALNGC